MTNDIGDALDTVLNTIATAMPDTIQIGEEIFTKPTVEEFKAAMKSWQDYNVHGVTNDCVNPINYVMHYCFNLLVPYIAEEDNNESMQ